jgi:hypothetical protein
MVGLNALSIGDVWLGWVFSDVGYSRGGPQLMQRACRKEAGLHLPLDGQGQTKRSGTSLVTHKRWKGDNGLCGFGKC